MLAAALPGADAKPAPRVKIRSPRTAQVHDGSQMLHLGGARGAVRERRENPRDLQFQISRRQFHRVSRQDAQVQAVEPAGVPVVPGALARQPVIVDAVVTRLGESRVGDLVHADGARGGPIEIEEPRGRSPVPVGAHQGIAGTLYLRQRR